MSDTGSPIRSVPNSQSSTPDETSHAWMEWQVNITSYSILVISEYK